MAPRSNPRKKKVATRLKKTKKASPPPVPLSGTPKVRALVKALARTYPEAECALNFKKPLELLVATILSAQCTDERVNQVTRQLFKKYRSPSDYADATPGTLEKDIRSTGFFNNKARSIRGAAAAIRDHFSGKVPREMEALLTLPGVARKTANVVLGVAFGIPSGVVVDTHVNRLSQRMGLSSESKPEKIEADLMEKIPRESWIVFGHRMILHGRQVCSARKPACLRCSLAKHCPSAGTFEA